MPLQARRTEVNQGTLIIKNLIPADSGLYECIATNTMGTKKATINVAVQQLKLGMFFFSLLKSPSGNYSTELSHSDLFINLNFMFVSLILLLNKVAEWLEHWICNSEAPSSSAALTASWIYSR